MPRSARSRPWKSLVPMIWMSTGSAAWAGADVRAMVESDEAGAGDELRTAALPRGPESWKTTVEDLSSEHNWS